MRRPGERQQRVDFGLAGLERRHQARHRLARLGREIGTRRARRPVVELGPRRPPARQRRVGRDDEDLVGLDGKGEAQAGRSREPLGEAAGGAVGAPRQLEPQIAGELGLHLGAEEAPLRQRLAARLR